MEKAKQLVEMLNGINENVWAVGILGFAVILFLKGQATAGGTLATGALALFQRK